MTKRTSDNAFLGHPVGLGWLAGSEFWERFSYYGMQALLVLYMTHQFLNPGHFDHALGFAPFQRLLEFINGRPLSGVALASATYGFYAGFVYLTPIAGGVIADRWLGKTATVTIGASLMALGHFLMAFDVSFVIALFCLLIGVGLLQGQYRRPGGRSLCRRRSSPRRCVSDLLSCHTGGGDHLALRLRHLG